MAPIVPLTVAVDELVHDGLELALEGPVPSAVGSALLRRAPRDLRLISTRPGPEADRLVEAGLVRGIVTADLGDAPRVREAVGRGLEIEEHTAPGMAARYAAGVAGLPFATVRHGYAGTDLLDVTRTAAIRCPFTGERLTALPALRPDLAIVHAARADRAGNVLLDGVPRAAALAARRVVVTVDEIVERVEGAVVPGFAITRVCPLDGAAPPPLDGAGLDGRGLDGAGLDGAPSDPLPSAAGLEAGR